MACPTAARMMVADPSPFRFAELPLEGWHHPATRSTSREALQSVAPLRRGWWDLLSEGRDDPERLAQLLAALHAEPLSPPARLARAKADPAALLGGLPSVEVGFVLDALGRQRARGVYYAPLRWELWRELTREVGHARLLNALDVAPPLLYAFVDHHVPFAGVHDPRPPGHWLRSAARRAVACARLVDLLLARVPFGIDTLFADACAAAMHLDANRTVEDAHRS
jgi:hypothetical protein